MTDYISRGVTRPCRFQNKTIARLTEKEKDQLAGAVLELVGRVSRSHADFIAQTVSSDPTGVGYLEPDIREHVMKRSA